MDCFLVTMNICLCICWGNNCKRSVFEVKYKSHSQIFPNISVECEHWKSSLCIWIREFVDVWRATVFHVRIMSSHIIKPSSITYFHVHFNWNSFFKQHEAAMKITKCKWFQSEYTSAHTEKTRSNARIQATNSLTIMQQSKLPNLNVEKKTGPMQMEM